MRVRDQVALVTGAGRGIGSATALLLAKLGGPHGIRANCISPGWTDTEMLNILEDEYVAEMIRNSPIQRLCRPEEVANTVLFLASEESSFITGQNIGVNGGLFMP